jgi:hypothetical protein
MYVFAYSVNKNKKIPGPLVAYWGGDSPDPSSLSLGTSAIITPMSSFCNSVNMVTIYYCRLTPDEANTGLLQFSLAFNIVNGT